MTMVCAGREDIVQLKVFFHSDEIVGSAGYEIDKFRI